MLRLQIDQLYGFANSSLKTFSSDVSVMGSYRDRLTKNQQA